MCGIIGLYCKTGNLKPNESFVREALYAGALRGDHGTGLAIVHEREKQPEIYKRAMPAFDFLSLRDTETLLGRVPWARCVIGHNRMKTHGRAITSHTHPFEHGHITLVHNGTVFTHALPGNHTVDSEQIAHALSLAPPQEVIPKLDGAFALVWWDAEQEAMFAVRNEQRPLWFGEEKNGKAVFFASELHMLRWICARNGIELNNVYQPTPGQLLKFKDGAIEPEQTVVGLYTPKNTHANNRATQVKQWVEHSVLKDNGLHVGSQVTLHPLYWTAHASNHPVGSESFGELVFMSMEHKCLFKHTAAKYLELDASKSYKANVAGSYHSSGEKGALVNQFVPDGENTFGLTNEEVYLTTNHPATGSTIRVRQQEALEVIAENEEALNYVPGPDNQLIKIEDYKRLIRHGCSMCSDPLDIADAPHVFDLHHNVYCSNCGNDAAIMAGVYAGTIPPRAH